MNDASDLEPDIDGEADDGPVAPSVKAAPERSCIVTRVKGTPETLLRFALAPDGSVVPDIRAKLPGRGAWVTVDHKVLAEAVRRKSFARAFKAEVTVSPDLVAMVDFLLEKDALQALSLANKAGLVVAGAAKVESALASKPLAGLIHAQDGSADGKRKLDASARRLMGEASDSVTGVQMFRSAQLDLALGRTNVIHAALAVGTVSTGFIMRARRLDRFRHGDTQAQSAAGPTRSVEE